MQSTERVRHRMLTRNTYRFFRSGGAFQQTIDNLDITKSYRIVYYYVKFDTPSPSGACSIVTTIGGQQIGSIVLTAPRTPNNQFEQSISTTFQPSTSLLSLSIGIACISTSSTRYYIDDVSIEEVTI